ncbi:hypothetical protein TpMuguga_04g00127 [Theileria parva strain Muguga]|uniref:Uncharacterized protein n=1 Tax=Theileria parva TaxID=5875 RepID=Q4N360_THEPA|nr:uncharacterized protein TpMuguga_04g00127 [Theileria parva strain Muguga]EAN31479.1 hypothetical protein TpMuguga_04g00127 [Theileria parva strain Muguga]|eukprot:XP_763762.1 hypothetical protein [Theileria parva strain Muguga]
MATIPDVTVKSNLGTQASIHTVFSNTEKVESPESASKSLDSDVVSSISNSIESKLSISYNPQTQDQQKVTSTSVTPTIFTPEDEKELRSQLNSLYRLLLKRNYNKPFLPDDPSFHPVNDPIYGAQNPSISGNLLYLYDAIIRKRVERLIVDIQQRSFTLDHKPLLIHEVKKAPGHLISQEEKDLLTKFIKNKPRPIGYPEPTVDVRKQAYHFIVHYLNEKLITFSKANNDLKDEEFELFSRLVTEGENLQIEKKIYQFVLASIDKNFRIYFAGIFRKHFSGVNYADLLEHIKNRLNEMYSVDLEQETNTNGQSMHNRITSKIPTSKKPQTTHSVINTPVNYSPEELELRAKLDSVYHLVFKKFYNKGLVKKYFTFPPNFDDSVCSIRDLFITNAILNYVDGYAESTAIWVLYNIAKNCMPIWARATYVEKLKSAPEDLIDQKEKDLLVRITTQPFYNFEAQALAYKIKAKIKDMMINYLKEPILAFSREFNLKKGKEFEFFNNLITQEDNCKPEDTIYRAILGIADKKVLGTSEDVKILQ